MPAPFAAVHKKPSEARTQLSSVRQPVSVARPRTGNLVRVIDLRTLRDDPDRLRVSQRTRGEDDSIVERLLELDERRRSALSSFESLRAEQKSFGRSVSKAQGDERQKLLDRGKELSQQVKEADAEAQRLDQELTELLREVPNIVEEGAPAGGEDDYAVLETVGTPPSFDFAPKDHLELGEALGAIDMERGAKVSGARFFYLTGVGAQLQLALLNLAMEQAIENGFTADDPARAGQAGGDGGHRLPRRPRRRGLPAPAGGPLPRRHLRGARSPVST